MLQTGSLTSAVMRTLDDSSQTYRVTLFPRDYIIISRLRLFFECLEIENKICQ